MDKITENQFNAMSEQYIRIIEKKDEQIKKLDQSIELMQFGDNPIIQKLKQELREKDEQAKKKAIAFADWTKQSKYCVNSMEEWFSYDSDEKPTTEQLYESEEFKKYWEQQNKEKV